MFPLGTDRSEELAVLLFVCWVLYLSDASVVYVVSFIQYVCWVRSGIVIGIIARLWSWIVFLLGTYVRQPLRPNKMICVFKVTLSYLIFLVKPSIFFFFFFFVFWKKKEVKIIDVNGINYYAKYPDKWVLTNCRLDPDQTVLWSGSTLFAILSVLLDTSKGNQTGLVKYYVNYGAKSKYIW